MAAHKSNTKPYQWTDEEVALLKLRFAAGKRIKEIASEIGRSETAINKFLSRTGIRGNKSLRPKFTGLACYNYGNWIPSGGTTYVPEQPSTVSANEEGIEDKGAKKTDTSPPPTLQLNLELLRSNAVQADIDGVLDYLKSKGHKIWKARGHAAYSGDYICDGRPISETKLLLLANRSRTEERQPIFAVTSLVW